MSPGFILVLFSAVFVAAGESNYIGSDKCAKMCHKSAKQGAQLAIWEKSKHAGAYKTLLTPRAAVIAKEAGITQNHLKSEKCLKCHATAYGVKPERMDSTFSMEQGVQCEACHGPGKEYAKLNIMKDKKKALEAGLIAPVEQVCVKCHNSESPTFKKFDFNAMVKKILHSKPVEPQ